MKTERQPEEEKINVKCVTEDPQIPLLVSYMSSSYQMGGICCFSSSFLIFFWSLMFKNGQMFIVVIVVSEHNHPRIQSVSKDRQMQFWCALQFLQSLLKMSYVTVESLCVTMRTHLQQTLTDLCITFFIYYLYQHDTLLLPYKSHTTC